MTADKRTLRARLLRLLGWPLLGMLLLSAGYDYGRALERARDDQDLALGRVAIALASRLDVDADDRDDDLGPHLARTMDAMQFADTQDKLTFAVQAADGTLLGGLPSAAAWLPAPDTGGGAPQYADHLVNGEPLRVVMLRHRSPIGLVRIVVTETTHRRAATARRVLIDTLLPNLLLVVLALVLVRRGVTLAMAPLDRLGRSVAARPADDLSPLPTEHLAGDLLPLVAAINRLMLQTEAAAAAQQAFLSNAAHQLRTPLANVQTQLELAAREAGEAQRPRLTGIQRALQRMTHTTHQMLALARAGPQAVQAEAFESVDLQALAEDAASIWLDAAVRADVDLGFDTHSAPLQASPWMLQELLGNLIDNAIRHSPRGGNVTVRCGVAADRRAWLSVEDEGPGVAAAERERVLERFYRSGGPGGGSGLGLAIVREVALRHHAALTLDATPGGQGLRVTVRFPA